MKRVMVVFGTRPEAIKMCPLVNELKSREGIRTFVCVTGQHTDMLSGVLDAFDVVADYNLSVMRQGQGLSELSRAMLEGLDKIFREVNPDIVLVHGDTSTAFCAALAAFYLKIPVGHVEAGLRTYDIYSPYPEEFNRRAISIIARYNFAPTEHAKKNLVREGVADRSIYITGNTVIDALSTSVKSDYRHTELEWAQGSRLILITAHRRENIGAPMRNIFKALRRVIEDSEDVKAIYPIHKNPEVRRIAYEEFSGCERLHLIEPLEMLDFHNFMARSYMLLTDSGGIQEEAIALGKPVLIMRNTTERPEGIETGGAVLTGTTEQGIYDNFTRLLKDRSLYESMCDKKNPYGDGKASQRIADIILRKSY
ncbi:MAG: UDP-N-acetylglucosamine 2-epimerase (non-hydrolyzing) [Ruminococcaceae bacterium]|nr:UDP-N-acetylglucosamine 2-epimerase (non-hydrolyzing) [Oscillospiraceae bacterium]